MRNIKNEIFELSAHDDRVCLANSLAANSSLRGAVCAFNSWINGKGQSASLIALQWGLSSFAENELPALYTIS